MSKNGMPTFHEIYMAHKEKDPEKREIAFAIIDMKRTGAILRSQNRKTRMAALEREWKRNEEREQAAKAQGVERQRRIVELQEQMRNGTHSLRNRRGW